MNYNPVQCLQLILIVSPWSVLLENAVVIQLARKFPFYGTRWFIEFVIFFIVFVLLNK